MDFNWVKNRILELFFYKSGFEFRELGEVYISENVGFFVNDNV